MQFLASSQLSPRMTETPEGYLICHDVPLANSRDMLYSEAQIQGWGWTDYETGEPIIAKGGLVNVSRTADMLFSDEVIASFNGKPVTRKHPPVMLKPGEIEHYQVGTVVNARKPRDGEMSDHMYGDLLVTHMDGITAVRAGGRGVSPGYDAKVKQVAPGLAEQHHIVGNHVAIDVEPRGGRTCIIGDETMTTATAPEISAEQKASWFDKLFGTAAHAPVVNVTAPPAAPVFDSAAFKAELLTEVKAIITEAVKPTAPKVEAPAPVMDAAEIVKATDKITVIMPDLEILKPGIAKPSATMDAAITAQREALTAATAGDHADALKPLIQGRNVATMDAATLDAIVPAAAFVVRGANDLATRKSALSGLASIMAPAKDADDINARAAAVYGDARGHVS